ncbi:uncharacterized protein [Antedon mediterranea]|uniref:uncharacterized protein n=1 Tax=Antedon mediterranea TaxID=105859 RepID=UPI003AF8F65E
MYHAFEDDRTPAWICTICQGNNYSSVLFDLHRTSDLHSNTRDSSCSDNTSISSLSSPTYASTPIKPKPKTITGSRPLRILNINCQSLVKKKPQLNNLIESGKPDIMMLTETWFKNEIKDSEYFSKSYTIHRRDRSLQAQGGGLIVAVNSSIPSSREYDLEQDNTEVIWVKVKLIQLLIGGDFNFPGWDWNHNTCYNSCPFPSLHSRFYGILCDNGLTQVVREATRGKNILDLIATNRPTFVRRTQVLPGISDHSIVYTELTLKLPRKNQVPRSIILYNKADWIGLAMHMRTLPPFTLTSSVDDDWNRVKTHLNEGIKKYIPSKIVKKKESSPWISRSLKRMMRRRDKAYKACTKRGRTQDEEKFRLLKSQCQREMRKQYWEYIENMITPKEDKNTYQPIKKFWKYIKHRKNGFTGVSDIKDDGRLVTDDKAKPEPLNQQFQSTFIHESPLTHTFPPTEHTLMPEVNITEEGVCKLLKELHPAKASGPDNISPRVLRELATDISPIFCGLFKKSLNTGIVPSDWKNANIVSIFKKGQPSVKRNYRPIGLTSIASKVMEHIITSSLMNHA